LVTALGENEHYNEQAARVKEDLASLPDVDDLSYETL
jgi:hypothetical protein